MTLLMNGHWIHGLCMQTMIFTVLCRFQKQNGKKYCFEKRTRKKTKNEKSVLIPIFDEFSQISGREREKRWRGRKKRNTNRTGEGEGTKESFLYITLSHWANNSERCCNRWTVRLEYITPTVKVYFTGIFLQTLKKCFWIISLFSLVWNVKLSIRNVRMDYFKVVPAPFFYLCSKESLVVYTHTQTMIYRYRAAGMRLFI